MKHTFCKLSLLALYTSVLVVSGFLIHSYLGEHSAEVKLATLNTATIESQLDQRFVSREPMRAYVSSARPMEGMTVIIDPGHGGRNTISIRGLNAEGATGKATRQLEKDVNLRVGLLLRYYLQEAGATVYMTRIRDSMARGMCVGMNGVQERCARANLANKNKADIFISVHHDYYGPKPHVNRSTVFYHQGNNNSIPLANNVVNALSYCLGTENGGIKNGNVYTILERLKVPGILVECSFMSNPAEDRRLADLSYNKLEAKAIAIGVLNYVRTTKGRPVDFASIFSPIDSHWQKTVAAADNTVSNSRGKSSGFFNNIPFFSQKSNTTKLASASTSKMKRNVASSAPRSTAVSSTSSIRSSDKEKLYNMSSNSNKKVTSSSKASSSKKSAQSSSSSKKSTVSSNSKSSSKRTKVTSSTNSNSNSKLSSSKKSSASSSSKKASSKKA